jgi:predicted PurR-regulated permease PerM
MSDHHDQAEAPSLQHEEREKQRDNRNLSRRVALVDGITVLFILLLAAVYVAADALLLVFACILFAIFLYKLTGALRKRVPLSHTWALTAVVAVLLAVFVGGGSLMAPQISEQAAQLAKAVPQSLERMRAMLESHEWLSFLVKQLPSPEQISQHMARMVPNAGLFFAGIVGALGNVAIIIFVGIYFAAAPRQYLRGLIKLVPQKKRARADEVLHTIGDELGRWLLGKFISMVLVGIITTIGLTMLGVPLALILGIIAGLLDFIPYLGPIIAGVPAVLIAMTIDPQLALYTIALFTIVQLVEGYLLQPLIEARAVALAPALVIIMQLAFGAFFGLAGVALATPLTAVLAVLVGMLYIEDVLGDKAELPKPGSS